MAARVRQASRRSRGEQRDGFEYTLFETELGTAGVAWSEVGLVRVQLPDATRAATERRLQAVAARSSGGPPPWARAAIEAIRRHLEGELQDFEGVPLDFAHVSPFARRVYELLCRVGAGSTASYAELAERAGSPGAARAVGQAMGRNPWPLVVPCHRVLAAGGRMGGFSAPGGTTTKERLLELEGVRLRVPEPQDGKPPYSVRSALRCLREDPRMAQLIERIGPFRLRFHERRTPFEALLRAIVYQQITGKAAAAILARVQELFAPARYPTPQELVALSDARLRSAGLSAPKMAAVRDLAERAVAGEVPTRDEMTGLEDEEIIERLVPIRGIGRWSAEMLLIFDLGRPDVFPTSDLGIRKGYAFLMGRKALPSESAMERRARGWRPWRSVASWYLWRGSEL